MLREIHGGTPIIFCAAPPRVPRQRKHPVESVPPLAVGLLADSGMKELAPALPFLKIKTDTQFMNIFTSGERAKAQLLANLVPLALSVFQASMMWFIIQWF
ncbi:hypothetical protein DFH09DRAFT_1073138 [Mycena vulgaris]|nr:hypothetical protein DFH09DRAFT_1073138 [Mycena vulgaris]